MARARKNLSNTDSTWEERVGKFNTNDQSAVSGHSSNFEKLKKEFDNARQELLQFIDKIIKPKRQKRNKNGGKAVQSIEIAFKVGGSDLNNFRNSLKRTSMRSAKDWTEQIEQMVKDLSEDAGLNEKQTERFLALAKKYKEADLALRECKKTPATKKKTPARAVIDEYKSIAIYLGKIASLRYIPKKYTGLTSQNFNEIVSPEKYAQLPKKEQDELKPLGRIGANKLIGDVTDRSGSRVVDVMVNNPNPPDVNKCFKKELDVIDATPEERARANEIARQQWEAKQAKKEASKD